jgi:hypothetical protein
MVRDDDHVRLLEIHTIQVGRLAHVDCDDVVEY